MDMTQKRESDRGVRRTVIVLVVVALLIYAGFLVRGVLTS
jgi:hypothetical protein